ncbi:MAG: hypothetical protein ACRENP_12535 [Longimicrobiales bacterium]
MNQAMIRIVVGAAVATGVLIVVLLWNGDRKGFEGDTSASGFPPGVEVLDSAGASGLVTRDLDTIPRCADCIQARLIGKVGTLTDSLLLRRLPHVVRDGRGRLLAGVRGQDHEILVYDLTRGLIGWFGRFGSGPGEMRRFNTFSVGPSDSISLVHDGRFLTVFDRDFRAVRSIRLPIAARGGLIPLKHGRYVIPGWTATQESAGKPLHLISVDGNSTKSFGTENIVAVGPPERFVSPGPNETIFAAERHNYRIEQLDTAGTVLRTIGIRPPDSWHFREIMSHAHRDSIVTNRPPKDVTNAFESRPTNLPFRPIPELAGLFVDSGHLWVAWHIGAANWESVAVNYRRTEEVILTDDYKPKAYDTIVDIIDMRTGELLARRRVAGFCTLMNDGSLARLGYSIQGVVEVEVFELSFKPIS